MHNLPIVLWHHWFVALLTARLATVKFTVVVRLDRRSRMFLLRVAVRLRQIAH